MGTKSELSDAYKLFSLAQGNQHIASEYAIHRIHGIIRRFGITKVLEVGLGIGSMSGSILKVNPNLEYTGTESSAYCLKTLPELLGDHFGSLKIFPSLEAIPKNEKFDLIIIDGKDPGLTLVSELLRKRGIIALEGDRAQQLAKLMGWLPNHKMVHLISLRKNRPYSPFNPGDWQGGLKILFKNPSEKQYLWWALEKFLTKVKYHYPGRFLGNP